MTNSAHTSPNPTTDDRHESEAASTAAQTSALAGLETPGMVRMLSVVVTVLGVILLIGLVTVIGRIIYLASRPSPPADSVSLVQQASDPTRRFDGATGRAPPQPEASSRAAEPARSTPAAPRVIDLPIAGKVEALALSGDQIIIAIEPPSADGQPVRRRLVILDRRYSSARESRAQKATAPVPKADGQTGSP